MNLLYLCCGAVLGAIGRWGLGVLCNPLVNLLQIGTLLANYIGCFLMGIMLALIIQFPQFSAEWRLFLITGFLGSFTTFSAFSAEVIQSLLESKYLLGIGIIVLHLVGSLLCTLVGVLCCRWLFHNI